MVPNTFARTTLWILKGIDAHNNTIGNSNTNCNNLKIVYDLMLIKSVGLLSFSMLLGRILLAMPNH